MDPCSLPTKSCHGASNRAAILGFLQIQFEANIQQEELAILLGVGRNLPC